tara:strand:+ start:32 stop:283 length:252 start_codon:yes stop_codon:yes gene_type:complete
MSKSRYVLDKFAKLIEQGLLSYKDLSDEILNILKSKRDEIVFRMKLTSKEEFDILSKRVTNLENKLREINKKKYTKKTKRVKK